MFVEKGNSKARKMLTNSPSGIPEEVTMDLAVRNALVVDRSGRAAFTADVARTA
jgi:hypothetical protein